MKSGFKFSKIFLLLLVLINSSAILSQNYTQQAYVFSNSGKASPVNGDINFYVIGEPLVSYNIISEQYSGSIGFLSNAAGNNQPLAIAEPGFMEVYSGENVSVDASASYDPEGIPLNYLWIVPDGIFVPDPTQAEVTFSAPQVNYHKDFEILLVVDDGLLSDTAYVQLSVFNPDWAVVVYPQSTICIAQLEVNCEVGTNEYVIGAFINDECRAYDTTFIYDGSAYVSFLIQGETPDQQITFKAIDLNTDSWMHMPEYPTALTNPGGNLGTFQSPFPLKAFGIMEQEILFSQGWSGISSVVNPLNQNINGMFSGMEQNLDILYNFSGIYQPSAGINTIGDWQRNQGYIVKTNGDATLYFEGYLPCENTVSLDEGWSIMPVLSQCPVDVEALYNNTDPVIIKEVAGWNIYWPQYNINSIGNLEPGDAYFVLMDEEIELSFPECGGTKMSIQNNLLGGSQNHFNIKSTAVSHTIALPIEGLQELQPGSIIKAYDIEGNCFGTSVWNGETTSITLFGNDLMTNEKDGFIEGDRVYFKVMSNDIQESIEVEYDQALPNANGEFQVNGISAIKSVTIDTNGANKLTEADFSVYPNPADESINISKNFAGVVAVNILNSQGVLLKETNFHDLKTSVDIKCLPAGVYFLWLNNEDVSWVKRIIIM